MDEIDAKLEELALGKLSPKQWFDWWEKNEHIVQQRTSTAIFLHIKPNKEYMPFQATAYSQGGVQRYFKERNIEIPDNDVYTSGWAREMRKKAKEERKLREGEREVFKQNFASLGAEFPNLFNTLVKKYFAFDALKPGLDADAIKKLEQKLDFIFTPELRKLIQHISVMDADGFSINVENWSTNNGGSELILGDFWLKADGDNLLMKKNDPAVYYYAHEEKGKLKAVAENCTEFCEKYLPKVLKSYLSNE